MHSCLPGKKMPSCNKTVEKRANEERQEEYYAKLQNVKPYLEITPPREYQHLQLSVKKLQMQQERQAAIDRQNQVILSQLMKIKQSPARVDNWNKKWKPSDDRLKSFRDRRQRRIKLENEKQHERLKNIQPYYDIGKWEKDYKKHQYYLWLLDGGTKEYEEFEDEDEESDDDEEEKEKLPPVDSPDGEKGGKDVKKKKEEQVKLPPIDGKKKGKDGTKKKEEYPEHVVIMDAEDIHKAIEENNKEKILQILGRVSEKKKMDKLKDKYKELYDKDLMEDVKPKLDQELQETLDCLGSGAEEDAKKLYEAMKGLGTDEDILIEILCTRTNAQLKDIRAAYSKKYENSLEEDLKGDTSGDLETLLVELSKGQRGESSAVDKELAKKDAKEIYEAGTASWGTDEGKFIRIFTLRSRPQLGATFPEYKKLTNKDIAESIDNEMDGDLQKAFLTLVKCIRDPTGFHSNKLHKALQDGDTNTVARIILGKNKAQLDELAAAYKKAHKVDLADEIDKKCTGDLRTLLLARLGKDKEKKKQQKPAEKQDKAKKEAAKDKPKAKPAAAQDNKKTDKNIRPGAKQEAAKEKPKATVGPENKKTDKKEEKNNEEDKEAAMEKDLDELRKAIEAGDKDKVVDILAKHSDEKSKLQQLKDKYKEKHDQDLLEAIKPVLEEEQLQDAADSLFMESDSYDAKIVYHAMKGLGTDEDVLIEVLCSRSNAELAKIKETYTAFYGTSLEKDIKGDTSGNFEDLLVELSKGKRDESSKVDKDLAKKDAEAIMQASFLGTDEDKFVQVFTQRSFPHLKLVFQEYKKLTNQEMDECIEEEMSLDLEKGFLALIKYSRDPSTFFANKIQKSLQDGETDTPGRIILTSTTAELADIIGGYKKLSGNDLIKDSDAKFSENMKKLILPKLKKAGQEQKEKEKASNADPKKKKQPAGGKQDGAGGKKPTANRKPSQQKKTQQDDKQEYAELRAAIDANDKKKIKEIVCRNLAEKERAKKLVEDYNSRYGKELFEALDDKLDEDLIEALAALSATSAQYDARTLYLAMKGLFTKEIVLIEMFSTRTNAEIAAIRQAYKKKYRKELEQVIKDDTSGDFETLLVELCKGQRDESTDVNDDLAHKDAESLLEAGIKKWGTDEETFITIFTTRSFPQLKAMLPEYKKWAKCEIEDTIDSEMSGDLREGLQTLVKCIRDQNQFFADKLQVALHGKSTATVARIIFGESSIAEIEKAYNRTYKPKLAAEVDTKCSNELKKLLLPKLKDTGPDKEPQKDEKPSDQKPKESKPEAESKPEVKASDELAESAEKQRGNDEGSGDQEIKKKEERPKLNIEKAEHHGTLKPADNFNAAEDAETLKKAMKGFGSDEDAIMAVLGARTNHQRQEIAAKYQQEYDKNLVDDLKSELGGKFEDAIVALMSSPQLYDANSLHDAMSGIGTDEAVLIEILCSRNSEEIQTIKSTFKEVHGKELVEEIKSETSGDLQSTLIKLVEGNRSTSKKVDDDLAYEDATKLFEAGEDKWGTEESVFVKILTTRSITQLQATFEAYKHVSKTDIMDSVNSELTGDFHDAVEAIVRCTRNPPLFFAETLEKAVSGLGSDSKAVTRIVVTRSEVDLADIKTEYKKKTGQTLKATIQNELKGDLEKLLLQIVGD